MTYSNELITTAEAYNLDPRTILFLQLVATGCNRADAYAIIFARDRELKALTQDTAKLRADELIKNNPSCPIYLQRFKTRLDKRQRESRIVNEENNNNEINVDDMLASEEDANLFADKKIMIRSLLKVAASLQGKEKSAVLLQIAELQQMKKEEIRENKEQRMYYLPFVSHCRTCKLYELAKNVLNKGSKSER